MLSNRGVETEKVDIEAYYDRSLTYHENVQNFQKQFGGFHKSVPIRPAGAFLKRGRKSIREDEFYQRGHSHTDIDKRKSAKLPGKRRSRTGKKYYERRKNRSDRPGWQGI